MATVQDPKTITFTVSPDHASIDKYVVGYFVGTAVSPFAEADLGKGTPNASNEVSFSLPPFAPETLYTAKVKAVKGAAVSIWSGASDPFTRKLLPPGLPRISA